MLLPCWVQPAPPFQHPGMIWVSPSCSLGSSLPFEHLTPWVGASPAALGCIPLFLARLLSSLRCWEPFPAAPQPSALSSAAGDRPLLCAAPALVSAGACPQQLDHCHLWGCADKHQPSPRWGHALILPHTHPHAQVCVWDSSVLQALSGPHPCPVPCLSFPPEDGKCLFRVPSSSISSQQAKHSLHAKLAGSSLSWHVASLAFHPH